jgi:CRP-like cAMP-binding protein
VALWGKPNKIALLEQIPTFRGLSRRELTQVAGLTDEVEVPAGKRLATAGETGREFFVIIAGEAGVRTGGGRRVRLGPGDFIGEMSLLDGEPRSATVEALTPMRLLVISHRDFWRMLEAAPTITRKIMRTLVRRVRDIEKGTG